MIFVDINIAKLNHYVSVLPADNKISTRPFRLTNNYDGFYLLFSISIPNNSIVNLESIAHCNDNLVHFLIAISYKIYVLNPVKTLTMCKNNVYKTNKIDMFMTTESLMVQDFLNFTALEDWDYIELSELNKFRQMIIKQHTRLKCRWLLY